MPLRDERSGRRATIGWGTTPLRAAFVTVDATTAITPAETPIGVDAEDVRRESESDLSSDDAPSAARERGGSTVEATSDVPSGADASSDANQRRSLLEPSAVLMALAQPLFALRTACMRLMQLPLVPNDVDGSARTASTLDSTPSVISERSFASEVASLLQLPGGPETIGDQPAPIAASLDERSANAVPLNERSANTLPHDERSSNRVPHDERSSNRVPHDERSAIAVSHDERSVNAVPLDEHSSNAVPHGERPANTVPHDERSPKVVPHHERSAIAVSHDERSANAVPLDELSANAVPHGEQSANAVPHGEGSGNTLPLGAIPAIKVSREGNAHKPEPAASFKAYADDGVSLSSDVSATESRVRQNIIVVPVPARPERVVPITRLPLRPQGLAITWTADVPEVAQSGTHSRAERHALLERLIRDTGGVRTEVIARAYREEDGEGRTLALRVLLRNDPQTGRSAFIEALRVGSDDERSLAVDGLAAIGARDALTPAFADRVDAIAAKAALSYVGTLARCDYRVQLAPFIDEKQIDTIMTLLAGIVE